MPQGHGQIQPRTWFVEFGLAVVAVSAAPAFAVDRSELELRLQTAVPPSNSEIRMCIEDVMDASSQGGPGTTN